MSYGLDNNVNNKVSDPVLLFFGGSAVAQW